MTDQQSRFAVGELIHHRLFGYRGVVVDVDADFSLPDEWYEQVARSRPPKDRPWYHVLVDGTSDVTYVAERNLSPDETGVPIANPLLPRYLGPFRDGRYEDSSEVH